MFKAATLGALVASATAISYDQDQASRAVYMCAASYCDVDTLADWSCPKCTDQLAGFELEATVTNKVRGTQGYVGYDPTFDAAVVVWRGSSNLQNWLEDFQINKVTPWNDTSIEVHEGFYGDVMDALPTVEKALDSLADKGHSKVLVTGHSLGAGMASITAYQLVLDGYDVQQLTTIGCPRTGNDAYYSSMLDVVPNNWRITHHRDIVVSIPSRNTELGELGGFHHTATEIYYNEDSTEYTVCDGSGEDPSCADQWEPWLSTSVADHETYIQIPVGCN